MSILDATLVHLKAGMRIPDKFLEEVFKVRKRGMSFACHQGKDVSITLERGTADDYSPEDIKNICEMADKSDIIFWFFSGPEKFHMEDIQPFVILGDENNPMAVGFSAGEFPNYIPSGSDHDNNYFLWNKFMIPMLHKISKDDLNKVFNELNDPLQKQIITNSCPNGSSIVLLSGTGRVDWFGTPAGSYEWGVVSDHHGYKEEPVRRMGKDMLSRAASGVKAMIGTHTQTETPVKTIAEADTDVAVIEDHVEFEYFTPTDDMRKLSNKALKNIYKGICGFIPANYKDHPTVKYPKRKPKLQNQPPKVVQQVIKDFKELPRDQIVTAAEVKGDKEVVVKSMPMMTPKLIQAVQANFLDNQSQPIPIPPDKLQAMEAKYPTFWEATKIAEEITDAWTWEDIFSLCTKYPVAGAVFAWNTMIHKLVLKNQITHTVKPEGEVEFEEPRSMDSSGTEPEVARPEVQPAAPQSPEPQKPAEVTPAAPPVPRKSALLGGRRKAM